MPEHIYITLVLGATAYGELRDKLTNASLTSRIFTHESVEHLDYDGLPLKSVPQGGDVSHDTCEEVKAAFVAAQYIDRMYFENDDPEQASLVDMSGTALRLETP